MLMFRVRIGFLQIPLVLLWLETKRTSIETCSTTRKLNMEKQRKVSHFPPVPVTVRIYG